MAINDKNQQVLSAVGQENINVHPELQFWLPSYTLLRDLMIGEIAIKAKGTQYVSRMEAQNSEEYWAFLDRAYLYNMTARSQSGLVGTIFRREPKIKNFPDQYKRAIKTIAKDSSSINTFVRDTASEIFTVGRTGVLLDMDAAGEGNPFFVNYIAENILDWSVIEIKGRYVLKEVLLREIEENRDTEQFQLRTSSLRYKATFRKLSLDDDGVYRQYVYRTNFFSLTSVTVEQPEVIVPKRLGVTFDFIPFVFFGPFSNNPQIEKPPLLDIALLNIAHFRSVAQLQHGRFYTAIPIYHIQVKNSNDKGGDYVVGPNVVWEYEGDKAPGIAEYNGQGLIFLENALEELEDNISSMGGRMLGTNAGAAAQSDNEIALKEKNEMSLLLNVVTVLNEGFSKLLQWWMYWQNETLESVQDVRLEVNKDFLFAKIDARDLRAFTLMYQENLLPIDTIYEILVKSDMIGDDVDLDTFKSMLLDSTQYPNDPDFEARQEGYPDAATKVATELAEKEMGVTTSQLKMTQSFTAQENNKNRANTASIAKTNANKPVVAATTPKRNPNVA